MSSSLLWAQRQEISTSHTSESGVRAESHSKCVILRDLEGGWDGRVWVFVFLGGCVNPVQATYTLLLEHDE